LMSGTLLYNVGHRKDVEVNVQQIRQPLYVTLSDGSIRDRYMVHIVNKNESDQVYKISVENIPADALDLGNLSEIKIRAGKALSVNAKVTLGHELAEKTHNFEFKVKKVSTGEEIEIEASFNSPKE